MDDIEFLHPDDDGDSSRRRVSLDEENILNILNEISQANSVKELHLETKKNFNKTLFQIGGTLFVAALIWLVSTVVALNIQVSELKYKVELLQHTIERQK